jgi:putative ABC transport system ATP-binding protein
MHPLVVEQVRKQYRQGDRVVDALAGVSLDVASGTFLAVMGASGSGKSTLLHLMAGLTKPDGGRVLVNDTDIGRLTASSPSSAGATSGSCSRRST